MSKIAPIALRKNQSGMVSIMVTMILMIVLSLIVIGFAQISRRNQREVLDRQLSTQAFYAAESGVNDVRNLIATIGTPPTKTACANSGAFYSSLQPNINSANGISYSCVLVNPTPPSLDYNNVDTTAVETPIQNADPAAPIKTLTLTWQPNASVASPLAFCPTSAVNVFSTTSNWKCGYGVMRIDLVPTEGFLTANSLAASTMTTFAVPVGGTPGTLIDYAPDNSNANDLTTVGCNTTQCQLNITNMQLHLSYYLRLSSLYQGVPMQINGTDVNGQPVKFKNGQVIIDATGKAQDVLRRVQVHVSIKPISPNPNPSNAITSFGPVCKRFTATGGYFALDPGIPSSVATDPLSDRLCK